MNNRPKLHISIYYDGNSKFKAKLKKQLSMYSGRVLSNPWEPSVDICMDTFDEQEEKQVQQALMYDKVFTYHTKQMLTNIKEVYTLVILLISLARQRLYDNYKTEDLMIISIIPSNADDQANNSYEIQWSLG